MNRRHRLLLCAAAALLLAAAGLGWAAGHDLDRSDRERPGAALSVTESSATLHRSYARTVRNDGATPLHVHVRYAFNVSVVRGNDVSGAKVLSLLSVDGQRLGGLSDEAVAFDPPGDYARDRLQGDFTVPPGGSRTVTANVTLTPTGPAGAAPWRIDYDPLELRVDQTQAMLPAGPAVAGAVGLACCAVACAWPAVRGRRDR
jgi:hypothetical protein